jgi:hypothetical protein
MQLGAALTCVFLSILPAFGEAGTGTIRGSVRDSSGSPVRGATVEVKNAHTKVLYSAFSDGTGSYTVGRLPVGQYVVTLRVPKMKPYSHGFLAIDPGAVVREDVDLETDNGLASILADNPVPASASKRAPGRDFLDEDVELVLTKPTLSLNGNGVELPAELAVKGRILWFYVRGHGRYLLSLAPNRELGFTRAGLVERATIQFQSADQDIQIDSAERIVDGTASYNLDVLHQADWFPAEGVLRARFLDPSLQGS